LHSVIIDVYAVSAAAAAYNRAFVGPNWWRKWIGWWWCQLPTGVYSGYLAGVNRRATAAEFVCHIRQHYVNLWPTSADLWPSLHWPTRCTLFFWRRHPFWPKSSPSDK